MGTEYLLGLGFGSRLATAEHGRHRGRFQPQRGAGSAQGRSAARLPAGGIGDSLTANSSFLALAQAWLKDLEDLEDVVLDVGRRDDVYVDHGVSGGRARRPEFDAALDALETGDTLVVTTLGRLSRSTANMLDLAGALRTRGAALRVSNLGGGDEGSARSELVACPAISKNLRTRRVKLKYIRG